MNREKYVKDKSYREGYTDGRREGINVVISNCGVDLDRLEAEISLLKNKLSTMKKETEDKA